MTFIRFIITLFDPTEDEVDLESIPDTFTTEYFIGNLQERWSQSTVRHHPSSDRDLTWVIPQLDSGDVDNDFTGRLDMQDKSIVFGLVPPETVVEFLRWIMSIIPSGLPVYLMKLTGIEINSLLVITHVTKDQEIIHFVITR